MVTTGERMAKIETQIVDIKEGLSQHVDEQRKDFDKVFNKLDEMHSAFAGKWVEKIVVGIIIMIIGSAVVLALKGGI